MGWPYKSDARTGGGVPGLDWRTWPPLVWGLYGLAALHLAGTVGFWFAFQRDERRARTGGPTEVARFNRSLRGFPNAFYAKMLGKRPLETAASRDEDDGPGTG